MHMLCKIKHVETKSGTLFKCTSIIFKRICHLPLSIPNAWNFGQSSNGTSPVKDRLFGPWKEPTWIHGITNQSIRWELTSLAVLADCGSTPEVGIAHWIRPAYIKIPKQTFFWHHTLQKNWMESFVVVVIWSMQSWCNNGYMRAIQSLHYVGNLVQVLKFLCISFRSGRRRPIDEFPKQFFLYDTTKFRDISLTRR